MRMPRLAIRRPAPPPTPPPHAPSTPDLTWVAEWIDNVRDHVAVRELDRIFIQRPNKAFKLNAAGARLLSRLLGGASLAEAMGPHADDPAAVMDVERFLLDVRRMLRDGVDDTYESAAVEKIPFEMNFSELPILSEVAVTYRCNAACTFCYAGCNCTTNPVASSREMTLAEIGTVLAKIANDAQVPSVSFTGGEATLRPDLPDMIRQARALGMRVNLVTNGIKCAALPFARTLVDAGLQSAQVSLEGTTAAVHESITRVPGSHDRVLAAVRNFSELGIRVHTNTTLTPENRHDAPGLPRFVKEVLGRDRFSMNLVIPTGSAARNGNLVRYTEVGPLLEELGRTSRALGVELMWYSPTPMCIWNPIVHGLGNKGCSACDGLVSVGADGQVLPCASFDRPVGDLLKQSFAAIWGSPEATALRAKELAHPTCRACEQFHICHGACPLYWRTVGFDELPAARATAPGAA